MAVNIIPCYTRSSLVKTPSTSLHYNHGLTSTLRFPQTLTLSTVWCSAQSTSSSAPKTCKNCKTQFYPSTNHPRACRYHTAHFGGETKRKFESVYTGGTMNTPDSGQVFQYWHCCGSEDPFDPGCTAAPHASYDNS